MRLYGLDCRVPCKSLAGLARWRSVIGMEGNLCSFPRHVRRARRVSLAGACAGGAGSSYGGIVPSLTTSRRVDAYDERSGSEAGSDRCQTWDGAVEVAAALLSPASADESVRHGEHFAVAARALLAPLFHAAALSGGGVERARGWLGRSESLRLRRSCAVPGRRLRLRSCRVSPRRPSGTTAHLCSGRRRSRSRGPPEHRADPLAAALALPQGREPIGLDLFPGTPGLSDCDWPALCATGRERLCKSR